MTRTPIDNTPVTKGDGLLPCPFCGGLPRLVVSISAPGEPKRASAECSICGASSARFMDGQWATDSMPKEVRLAKAWNTRATQPLTYELRAEMVEGMAKAIVESWKNPLGKKGDWDAYNEGGKDNFRRDAKAALSYIEQQFHLTGKW